MNWQLTQLTRDVLYMIYDAKHISNKSFTMNSKENKVNGFKLKSNNHMDQNNKNIYSNFPLLAWEHLTVTIPVSYDESIHKKTRYKEWRLLLDSVSGHINSGELVALMGPSGAGKSTLLSILSHRIKSPTTSGKIFLNGECVKLQDAEGQIGFVPQHDLAFERLTAKEHLHFMAELRFGKNKNDRWMHRVEELLEDFNLCGCFDVLLENLSGGERKRLSLAVELLTRPMVLLCDEPCTGLDSSTALHIIQFLKKETQKYGLAIMCSLHQPASKLMSLFDRVLILGNRGKPNLVEFVIKEDGNIGGIKDQLGLVPEHSVMPMLNKDICKTNHLNHLKISSVGFQKRCPFTRNKLSWSRQVFLILKRNWISSKRRPFVVRFATSLVALATGIFIAIFYSNKKPDPPDQAIIQDLRGVLYLLSSEVMFANAYTAMGRLPDYLALMRRERGLYDISAAYAADVLILIPKAFFEPLILLSCIFWFIQLDSLKTIDCFVAYAVLLMYSALVANSYGCFLFGILGSASLASEVAAPLDLLLLLLSGMFLALPSLPRPLMYLRYLSAFYYCNDAFAVIHWAQVQNITCPLDDDLPCLHNGTEVLQRFGFTTPPQNWISAPADVGSLLQLISNDLLGLFILAAIMHVGAYVGLRKQANKEAAY